MPQIDDYKERLELAKIIGLDEIPEPNIEAIDRLAGIFDDLDCGPIDSVELIKEIRQRDYWKYRLGIDG